MSERPSFFASQRFLIIGLVLGLLLGCAAGTGLGTYYAWQVDPAVYADGAYPEDLASGYQNNYLSMVVDSHLVSPNAQLAAERLQTFDTATQVRVLGERSAEYVAAGRATEAQLINQLAQDLSNRNGWDSATVQNVIADLSVQFQPEPAKAQAISTFSAQLLNQVPVPVPEGEQQAEQPPVEDGAVAPAPAPEVAQTEAEDVGLPWWALLLCCLSVVLIAVLAFLLFNRSQVQKRAVRSQPVWEGQGKPPLKQWRGTYTLGQDNYDEFFTIETDSGDFLGESGIGIMDSVPNTSPKQVLSFDVGLFDKTDITTLSRVVMSEWAYNDDTLRAKIEANPQAEAVLAEPGAKFSFETTAMRVEAVIEEVEYSDAENKCFEKLTSKINVFLKEGADIRAGEMDIPEQFQ